MLFDNPAKIWFTVEELSEPIFTHEEKKTPEIFVSEGATNNFTQKKVASYSKFTKLFVSEINIDAQSHDDDD